MTIIVVNLPSCRNLWAWFKKGSGTVVRSTLRAVPATVPDPFFVFERELSGDLTIEAGATQYKGAVGGQAPTQIPGNAEVFVLGREFCLWQSILLAGSAPTS